MWARAISELLNISSCRDALTRYLCSSVWKATGGHTKEEPRNPYQCTRAHAQSIEQKVQRSPTGRGSLSGFTLAQACGLKYTWRMKFPGIYNMVGVGVESPRLTTHRKAATCHSSPRWSSQDSRMKGPYSKKTALISSLISSPRDCLFLPNSNKRESSFSQTNNFLVSYQANVKIKG